MTEPKISPAWEFKKGKYSVGMPEMMAMLSSFACTLATRRLRRPPWGPSKAGLLYIFSGQLVEHSIVKSPLRGSVPAHAARDEAPSSNGLDAQTARTKFVSARVQCGSRKR